MTASGSAIERGQPPALRARVLNGVKWNVIAQVALQPSRMIVAMLVARLLTPSDYGLAAMALVFSSLVLVFSDLALGAAMVQRETITQATADGVLGERRDRRAFTVLGVACRARCRRLYGQTAHATAVRRAVRQLPALVARRRRRRCSCAR